MKNDKIVTKSERSRRYPIRCIECGKVEVRPAIVDKAVRKNHDGRVYDLTVEKLPVNICAACGETYFTEQSDDEIVMALRKHLELLTPKQIRDNLEALHLNQKQAASILGIAPETLSRWLSGSVVQSRAMDNFLRAFFESDEVRQGLQFSKGAHRFGEIVSTNGSKSVRFLPVRESVQFPALERNGIAVKSREIAGYIEQSGRVFAMA